MSNAATAGVPPDSDAPAHVGENFTTRVRISEAQLRAFATLVDDHNPLHHDEAVALAAGYRGVIASGTQLASLFMAMTATHFARPDREGRRRSGVGMGFDIRFRAPVYPDEDMDLAWNVVGIDWKPSLAGWITRLEGEVRAGETLLLTGTGTLLLRRPKPPGAP